MVVTDLLLLGTRLIFKIRGRMLPFASDDKQGILFCPKLSLFTQFYMQQACLAGLCMTAAGG